MGPGRVGRPGVIPRELLALTGEVATHDRHRERKIATLPANMPRLRNEFFQETPWNLLTIPPTSSILLE
jgi:hypothetical protein